MRGSLGKARWLPWLLLLLAFVGIQSSSRAQSLAQSVRVVSGTAQNSDGRPQPNAVVYLQDQKTQQVRTYITEADGNYRFGQLASDTDYQLWAEYKGHKSKIRAISSFDSKKQFQFDLKIDTGK
jgi:Carboxypeptidase regulatory-like domain